MIELENLPEHLASLNNKDWDRLFNLLPLIEATEKFGEVQGGKKLDVNTITFPFWSPFEIVEKTISIIKDLKITPVFDWPNWEEGKIILNDKKIDYSRLDSLTLCKLLTTIIRSDRFSDGFIIQCFESRVIEKIIKELKVNQQSVEINNR